MVTSIIENHQGLFMKETIDIQAQSEVTALKTKYKQEKMLKKSLYWRCPNDRILFFSGMDTNQWLCFFLALFLASLIPSVSPK